MEGKGKKPFPTSRDCCQTFCRQQDRAWRCPSHQQTHLLFLTMGSLLSSGTQNHNLGLQVPPPQLPLNGNDDGERQHRALDTHAWDSSCSPHTHCTARAEPG